MKKQQKPKTSQYYTPVSLQWLLLLFVVPLYAVMLIFQAWSVASQAQQGMDVTSQLAWLFGQQLVPALIFVLAYVMNPRKLSVLSRLFESLLIALAAYIGWSFLGQLLFTLFYAVINKLDVLQLEAYSYVSYAVFVVLYVALLIYLRASRRWR